jgi:RimJ/RimL family protein N-acetyltransferase
LAAAGAGAADPKRHVIRAGCSEYTMLTTEFLESNQFPDYASWLKSQDPQTIHDYFGCAVGSEAIDKLIAKFLQDSKNHRALVAKISKHWVGTIHIAAQGTEVEFGVIVAKSYRKQGIANAVVDQAITWTRNRHYKDLFMHCISWNLPIKQLCRKHGLTPRNMMGDSEVNFHLEPPTPVTFFKELLVIQRNWLAIFPFPR